MKTKPATKKSPRTRLTLLVAVIATVCAGSLLIACGGSDSDEVATSP